MMPDIDRNVTLLVKLVVIQIVKLQQFGVAVLSLTSALEFFY